MSYVIKVDDLSKSYIIGHQKQDRYQTFSESLRHTARGLYQRMRHPLSPNCEQVDMEEFWALKDVSFEVKQGNRIGIIGRNGAGKSTLLKILSRITEPTTGRVKIRGRVASLLEVGTGFHPELTGRENIFLNGAILGMSRQEIKKKFDEIVDFSEIEKFLDTPVKRYSSGMYVRLAFAVAAHLEPEILIIDEVLAVGDAAFQKKCLGKMKNVSKEGRTILFVSHNMGAVQQLTGQCVFLHSGIIKSFGKTPDIINHYMNDCAQVPNIDSKRYKTEDDGLFIEKVSFDKNYLKHGFNQPLKFDIEFNTISTKTIDLRIPVFNIDGSRIMTLRSIVSLNQGIHNASIILKNHFLPCGNYKIDIAISSYGNWLFIKKDIISFEISPQHFKDPLMTEMKDRLGVYHQVEAIVTSSSHA